MSKLGCRCGAIIRDQTDHLPYRGEILKDQDREAFLDTMCAELTSYIASVHAGTTESWLADRPGVRDNPEWIVHRAFNMVWLRLRVDVYECPECGRLWVQKGTETEEFASFLREEPGERVLPSEHFRPPAD